MEGRFPTGIFVVFAYCKDPAKEAQLQDWYNNIHIPDVTGKGIFKNATRFINPRAKGADDDPTWLAVYETEREDVVEAWEENLVGADKWSDGDGLRSLMAVPMRGLYKRMDSSPQPPAGKKTRGILASMKDCKPGADEAAFNKWHDEVHTPEVLGAGAYWGGMRFVNTNPKSSAPKYLNIYESELDAQKTQKIMAARPNPDPTGGLGEWGVRRYGGGLNLLFSQAATGEKTAAQA